MIRTLEVKNVSQFGQKTPQDEAYYFEFAGLSTDSKPTDKVATGSVFTETNTGKVFIFSEPSTWKELGS